jgi:hypothetical protein
MIILGKKPSRDTLVKFAMIGYDLYLDDLCLGNIESVEDDTGIYYITNIVL